MKKEELEKILPKDGPNLEEVQKYINKYKNEIIVVKYGGNVLIDRQIFNNFITDLTILFQLGLSVVVVHGGGPRIKRELDKSNIKSKFIRGLRVTDEKIINVVEKVLIEFNEDIVSSLKEKGINGISLNTKQNNVIEVIPEAEELGFVGIPNKINVDIIKDQIKNNLIPIVSPLGLGTNNQAYNINGDNAAGAIAKSLRSRRLLLMTNVEGVLDKNKKLIQEISTSEILEMIKNGTITEGMIPKINTCLDAINNGVTAVAVGSALVNSAGLILTHATAGDNVAITVDAEHGHGINPHPLALQQHAEQDDGKDEPHRTPEPELTVTGRLATQMRQSNGLELRQHGMPEETVQGHDRRQPPVVLPPENAGKRQRRQQRAHPHNQQALTCRIAQPTPEIGRNAAHQHRNGNQLANARGLKPEGLEIQ